MPGVDEQALRLAIDAGVRAALAQLESEPEAENLDLPPENPSLVEAEIPEEPALPSAPSPLRQAARGQIVALTSDGEDVMPEPEGMRGDVVPIGAVEPSWAPTTPDWFIRQRQIDAAQRRMPAWENVVRQA